MARLSLQPMPQPADGGTCVGHFDGLPCTFHGRIATVGDRQYESKEIAEDILAAVEEKARMVFGPEWIQCLALVTGLNLRTVQRDRIGRYGLPAHVLRALAEAAAEPWPRVTGDLMQATARLMKTNALGNLNAVGSEQNRYGGPPVGVGNVHLRLGQVADHACVLVERMAADRMTHRAPALADE